MRGGPRTPRRTKWLYASGAHVGQGYVRVGPAQDAEERRLLALGLTIKEVATRVGAKAKRVEERSRLLYQIDVPAAFRQRIEAEGIPNRLAIDDGFGHWFAGLFDGEGHFAIDLRGPRPGGNWNLALGLSVYLRDDDSAVLARVHLALGGRFRPTSKDNVAHWSLFKLADLAEIAVPLFERYPLYSKKSAEFELFRSLVYRRYVATLGGRRRGVALEDIQGIKAAISELRARRRYADRSSRQIQEGGALYGRISSIAA